MSGRLRDDEAFVALIPSLARDLGSRTAAAILQFLHFKAEDGTVTITKAQIAEGVGCSERTAHTHIAALREDGIIDAKRTSWGDATKTYTINYDHPLMAAAVAVVESEETAGCNSAIPAGSLLVVKNEKNPPTPRERGGVRSTAPAPAAFPGFPEFWAKYPRKVGKQAAVKAYRAALRVTDPATILAALDAQLPVFAEKDPRFIPHASTWLNAGRWEDELPEPVDDRTEWDRIRDMERQWERAQA